MKHSIYNVFVSFAITFSVILIQVILIVTFSLFNSTATRWSHYHSFVYNCNAMPKTGSVHVCIHACVQNGGGGGGSETELERQAYGQTEKQIDMMTET